MKNTSGFTLMELSMVLIVIGFLAGAVAIGFQVIESAKIRGTVSQISEYNNAINSFRDQYFGWPGDITNAGSLWSDCDATPANCNGNGNGIIDTAAESYRAWQQLRQAELVSGGYTGTSSSSQSVIGTNVPEAKIGGAGFSIYAINTGWASLYLASQITNATNTMLIGKPTNNDITSTAGVLTPYSYEIDQKIDDGFPSSGILTSNNNASCPNGDTPPGYNITQANTFCLLVYQLQ